MNIIIPLCGIGKRFTEAGYDQPKPLIDVFDKKMIFHVLSSLKLCSEDKVFNNAVCYFPFFVAVWFGTTPNDELIDVSFPFIFIQKFLYFVEKYIM
jgi:NDP-sugar pyrophosphorylase family protein